MKIKELIKIKHKKIEEKTIIHYPEVRDLCARAYPHHPLGCINIDKCNNLNVPDFQTINECGYLYYYVVYCIFDRKGYRNQIGKKDNMRWWQNSLKSLLRKECERIYMINVRNFPSIYVFGCGSGFRLSFQGQVSSMEHASINVFSTMRLNGVKLDINPIDKVILCTLLISKKPLKFKEKMIQKTLA